MVLSSSWLRKLVFSISTKEASFSKLGFRCSDVSLQKRLEGIAIVFVENYNLAVSCNSIDCLGKQLNEIDKDMRGFAFEGAAMGLAVADFFMFWQPSKVKAFLSGPAQEYDFLVHVGVGWAIARLKMNVDKALSNLDPLIGWLAIDGYGFHEGFFSFPKYVDQHFLPSHISGYVARAFDQGLGRSIWFVEGADIEKIPKTVSAFPEHRHADLWSGVGLACAYAGIRDKQELEKLKSAAGKYKANLAQGAIFAAMARQKANNLAEHTNLTCQVFCGLSGDLAAKLSNDFRIGVSANNNEPAYEVWRQRIQAKFA
jgi:hypothetical protein